MFVPSSKALAQFARDYRSRHKLSQTELGDRVGLPQKTVSAFENQAESTKIGTFFKLISALGLELHLVPKGKASPISTEWDEEW
jgi:HTH-type transcriptional regulator / antitoxin HipB